MKVQFDKAFNISFNNFFFIQHQYYWLVDFHFICSLFKEAPQLKSSNDKSGNVVFDQKFLDKLEEVKKYEL
jgi:hypothetical protein